MTPKPIVLAVLAAVLAAFAVAAWITTRLAPITEATPTASAVSEALIRPYPPIIGPKDAPVTIVEFFDPACEACRAFYPVVEDILAEYPQDVLVVLRYTPFHGEASEQAIKVLEVARLQGVFKPVLEALLAEQPQWASHDAPAEGHIMEIAEAAGLDTKAAATQVKSPSILGILNQDRADVETMGVRQTPTFFVNGLPLADVGADQLRTLVAEEVARVGNS